MAHFLEERLPVCIKYGGSFSENHAVSMTSTVGGDEYRTLRHPFVMLSYDVSYEQPTKFIVEKILDLYSRANGMFRGFRVKDHKDFTTRNYVEPPTAFDQPVVVLGPGLYQLMRWYGAAADPLCARRRLLKPVAGTVKLGVGGKPYPVNMWAVDLTKGLVTLEQNKTVPITSIKKGQTTVLGLRGHTFSVGQSIVVSDIAGMAQINRVRSLITATAKDTVTIGLDSRSFDDYISDGAVQTWPIAGESVTAGCEFDIPCRFNSDLSAEFSNLNMLDASGIEIIEILNP